VAEVTKHRANESGEESLKRETSEITISNEEIIETNSASDGESVSRTILKTKSLVADATNKK